MQARLITAEEPRWEELVKANPASGFMQSLHWARFKQTQHLVPVHIGLFDDDNILIGGGIFYTADMIKGTGFMVAPDGPVLPWDKSEFAREGLRHIVALAERYAEDHNQIAVRIQPRLALQAFFNEYEFGRAPVDLTPKETLFLDLTIPEEELLARMKPKTRYNLRLAHKHGVHVREDDSTEAICLFHKLMLEAAGRDGFYVEPLSFFQPLVETLAPSNMVRLFFAEHEGDVLGTLMMLVYGNRATYLYGGIRNVKRNVMPGYALQWAAIKAAQQAGISEYDFYGFDQLQSPLNQYARFSRFKSGFGGTPIRYVGAHDLFFLDRLADVIVKAVGEVDWDDDHENETYNEVKTGEHRFVCR
jgi:peptidoglycan pentaglycine glycine transferase (the first glycine)